MIRRGERLTGRQQLRLTVVLAMPAIFAQLSGVLMEYIDAAMVGSLGAGPSASIGLMATSMWLMWGLCTAVSTGFAVQVAHRIGASDIDGARSVLRQSILATGIFGVLLAAGASAISGALPYWLGGSAEIAPDASLYFLIFALFMPVVQLNFLAGQMLRCSGNTLYPGMVNIGMCVADVVFNYFLIFPTHTVHLGFGADAPGWELTMPGAGMGVAGAALGTGLATLAGGVVMMWHLYRSNPDLNLRGTRGSYRPARRVLRKAAIISAPVGAERILMCGAQILTTVIVAPLGVTAIAANAFAVTAESLCYMPGFGIGEAATTLVWQSVEALRRTLARRFAYIAVTAGIVIMTVMGAVMWCTADMMMAVITPVADIRALGAEVLRIEAWAEPMFAAEIVAYGVFVGAGDTFIPACMNFGSIWCVRLTLAALLAPTMGLRGVWIAMAVELCFRGIIFLWRLLGNGWLNRAMRTSRSGEQGVEHDAGEQV